MSPWKMVDPLMRHQGERVLRRLLEGGHEAYFVGGCVRDEFMGRPVHDMDIATSAEPEVVIRLFERTVPTGLQHGTVTVLMENHAFEVTTFRKEAEYEDHRRPSSVEFVKALDEDLRRRDFTMNAIACDVEGRLTDPYGGRKDIDAQLIRCVGNALERFDEDALRMMRAIRFASVFGFRPVKSLWAAMLKSKSKMSYIAMERIRTELEKMMLGPDPLRGLALLQRSGLLEYVKAPVPDAAWKPYEEAPSTPPWLGALQACPPEAEDMRWSLLLQGLHVTGDESAKLMKQWTFSNAVSLSTANLIRFDEQWSCRQSNTHDSTQLRRSWIELQLRYGPHVAAGWIRRQEALISAADSGETARSRLNRLQQEEARWHKETVVHSLRDLAINGGDVIRFTGNKGGPWLGDLMDRLLLQVALGEVKNERETLLEQAKVVVNEHGAS